MEEPAEDAMEHRLNRDPQAPRTRHKTSIAELLADQRWSQAVLDFLENTDVGRTSGPPVAEEADEEARSGTGKATVRPDYRYSGPGTVAPPRAKDL